ncbi:MAG TPA: HAMP domain-containing sensor histidine kinase [Pyrinomonadaceae bacterium]|nr:HAMP domain-containing sensor histidine kinase [Pyrinomonadaceae bacterium]
MNQDMELWNRALQKWRDQPRVVLGGLAVLLATVEVLLDWTTWIQLNISLVYGLPLILAAAARSRRLLWALTSFLIGITFIVYSMQIPPGLFSLSEPFFVNRVLSSAAMLLTAGLGHIWIKATEQLDAQGRTLKEQNEALKAANIELVHHQELIANQNDELERRRREAEEVSSRKSRLLASVSHDIRQPINIINLTAEVMLGLTENPALAVLVQRLRSNAQSMTELISDLLDMAQIDSGRIHLNETVFVLNDLIAGQCSELRVLAEAKGLQLEAELLDQPTELRTDRSKLSRVLSNLIGNAVKFTEKGRVTVSATRSPDGDALISVRDSGIGIAPEQLDRIFDEFAQMHKPQRERTGWGLGLAICRRLVDVLGGAITVHSVPGQGSVFTLTIPSRCVVEVCDEHPFHQESKAAQHAHASTSR